MTLMSARGVTITVLFLFPFNIALKLHTDDGDTSTGCTLYTGCTCSALDCPNGALQCMLYSATNSAWECIDQTQPACVTAGGQWCSIHDDADDDSVGGNGDPHITNIRGQHFDVLQAGRFSLLSLTPKVNKIASGSEPLLRLDGIISRVADECSEAYTKNISLSGAWIYEMGYSLIEIRGQPSFIEVGLDKIWQSASSITSRFFEGPDSRFLTMKIRDLVFHIDIQNAKNKTRDDWQEHTRRFGWSYLNLKIDGLRALRDEVNIHGLLGVDDFAYATELPENCTEFFKNPGADFRPFRSTLIVGS